MLHRQNFSIQHGQCLVFSLTCSFLVHTGRLACFSLTSMAMDFHAFVCAIAVALRWRMQPFTCRKFGQCSGNKMDKHYGAWQDSCLVEFIMQRFDWGFHFELFFSIDAPLVFEFRFEKSKKTSPTSTGLNTCCQNLKAKRWMCKMLSQAKKHVWCVTGHIKICCTITIYTCKSEIIVCWFFYRSLFGAACEMSHSAL